MLPTGSFEKKKSETIVRNVERRHPNRVKEEAQRRIGSAASSGIAFEKGMAPHDLRRPFKRPAISDQQRRRELSLLRQAQNRRDAQHHARCLASTAFSLASQTLEAPVSESELEIEAVPESQLGHEPENEQEPSPKDLNVVQASKLKGVEARKWFAKQLMHPEWMIDIPDGLSQDWY